MINEVNLAFVTVSDQDSAIEFWTQKCGFTVATDQAYGEGQRWVEVAPPQGTAHLALVPPMQEGQEPGGDAPVSFTTDDVEAAHSEMGEKGIERDDIMRMDPPVPPMFFFSDPDGNRFLLVQPSD